MLIMRVKRFIKRIGRKLDLNGKETVSFDRTKVKCNNCHRRYHFARECKALRNQENRNRDSLRWNELEDTSTTYALVVQDGICGCDWSFQAKEGLTNFALMAYTSQDKTGLGYDGQMNESDLNDSHVSEREVLDNVFDSMIDSHESDGDDNQVNNRFKKGKGYHAVSPPYTGNYMPLKADLSFVGLDDSVFKSKESDIEDGNVFKLKEVKKIVKPSLEKIEFVNARNTTVENENKAKKPRKFSQSPRGNKRNWNSLMTQRLGDGFKFKKKSCFVCGIFNHLTKDCDFYENKMMEKSVLNNKRKITSPKEIRPVWDNTARVNHQSKLTHPHPKRNIVPVVVLTKSRQVPVNDAKQSSHRATTLVSAARRVNTADQEILDSRCSRHMTGNKSYLIDYQEINGGFVVFGRNAKGGIENQMDHKVKIIRCDNGTEFKNRIINEFCEIKGIMREFSVARTLQQNGATGRKNRTLIEAARTMLADSKLPTNFWAEAVNTACYVQNRVLVIKPYNKTPYELFLGRKPALRFRRPFGCLVISLNTLDHLRNQTYSNAGPKSSKDEVADDAKKKGTKVPRKENGLQDPAKEGIERAQRNELESMFGQDKDANGNSTYRMFTPVNSVGSSYVNLGRSIPVNAVTLPNADLPTDHFMPDLEDTVDLQDTGIFIGAYDDEVEGAVVVFNNLEPITVVSHIPTTKIHKDHPQEPIIEDLLSALQTRRMTKTSQEHAMVSYIEKQRRTNHKDYQNCLFVCFFSQIEPKKLIQALTDPRWIKAMQDELL
nr:putative ribonuclease H-like domain-containing protein [Tanacetum cinerariifolium]